MTFTWIPSRARARTFSRVRARPDKKAPPRLALHIYTPTPRPITRLSTSYSLSTRGAAAALVVARRPAWPASEHRCLATRPVLSGVGAPARTARLRALAHAAPGCIRPQR
eukprot:scaffold74454_cov65-Phaeocystis_antarctica.AAC.7